MDGVVEPSTSLTARQAQVVQLAIAGMSDKEIARHLGLSRHTVLEHFTAARLRVKAATRAELIATVVRSQVTASAAGPEVQQPEPALCELTHATGVCPEIMRFLDRNAGETNANAGVPSPAPRNFPPTPDSRARTRRVGRPTVMTPDRLAAARELLRDYPLTQVARKLGVSRTTLYAHLRAFITDLGKE